MHQFFRKLPLAFKLVLIGLIPLMFLVYLTLQLYREKNDRLKTLEHYIEQIHQSADISGLIRALQAERKTSFDYALGKGPYGEVTEARKGTDSLLAKIRRSSDPAVHGFEEYSSIDRLLSTRKTLDTGKVNPNTVMHNYSNTIFRLNTLNAIPTSTYLQPVYKDMVAQKLLAEICTYLGIIRSNIYNVLITRKYMVETLFGTVGTFEVYKSYEKELLMKASPQVVNNYNRLRQQSNLSSTNKYLDTLFKTFSFDSTLTADRWWEVSNGGLAQLWKLQKAIWSHIETGIHTIYDVEKQKRDRTLVLFIVILVLLGGLITYTAMGITYTLRDLKLAAEKIAKGSTEVAITPQSNDAIGSLAQSINEIARSNREMAAAADAIGNGSFGIAVFPRSREDVLANAIVRMKEALRVYSERMEALVKQRTEALENSNRDLQQFAHVVSHDLKEPLRKISTFLDRLMIDNGNSLTEKSKVYLAKIGQAATRLSNMIDGILTYSSAGAATESFQIVDLNAIVANVKSDLELVIEQKRAIITSDNLPQIEGAPVLLNQLLYNLVNNSLKFVKPHEAPVIHIGCRKPGAEECFLKDSANCYEIIIQDNGIGFEAEDAEKIFQTFSRLHSRSEYEGTGLGLALCRRITEYHSGRIWAESSGNGATIKIVLPQKQQSRSLAAN